MLNAFSSEFRDAPVWQPGKDQDDLVRLKCYR
jgi:hypothetical protein